MTHRRRRSAASSISGTFFRILFDTWTFYTIVRSLYHTGKIPWKEIMVSGFVLAKPGEKISKSKNTESVYQEYYRQSETDLLGCTRAEKIMLRIISRSASE